MKRTQIALLGSLCALTFAVTTNAKDVTKDELATLIKDGKVMSIEKLDAIALAKHPGGSVQEGAEVELHHRGYVYEVEVTDAKGVEWDMDINATSGKILSNKKDD